MKSQKVIIISLAVIIIVAAIYYVVYNRTSSPNTQQAGSEQSEQSILSTQSLIDGAVTYKITPKNLTPSATTWDFDMNIDTHTGSLDQDLVSIVRMIDDRNNEYKALEWKGDPPGGHHREGVLKFSAVTSRPSFIEIRIQTTGSTEKARVRWNL